MAERALEDTAYLSPAFLEPAVRHLVRGRPEQVVFIYRDDERLVGVASFVEDPARPLHPFAALRTSAGPHAFCPEPLLDRECAADALRALCDWTSGRRARSVVRFEPLAGDSPFLSLIGEELRRRGTPYHAWPSYERPRLSRPESFEAYLAALPKRRRQGVRQGQKRLAERGRLGTVLHRDLRNAPDLVERFLSLESLGWKGVRGVALAGRAPDLAAFVAATRDFADAGRLFFVELTLESRPIAMTTGFVAGSTLFCFKSGYDPAFADCSPGILAEVETVRMFCETPELRRADAGTSGPTYLSGLWPEAVLMWTVCAATDSTASRAFVRLLPWLFGFKRWLAGRGQASRSARKVR